MASATAAAPIPVAVVIAAHQSGAALAQAATAALQQCPAELVIVDNASSDGCTAFVAAAQKAFPRTHLQLHALATNIGFAAACNLGTELSCAPYLLFLNDDAMLRPNYLPVLCAALAAEPRAASAIGKLVYLERGQQHIDSAGITLVRHALRPQDRGQDEPDCGQYDTACDVFGPTGAAALYRRSALTQVGGFDARLFAYYEDVDLAWRLGRSGWRHLYRPQAVAVHRRRGPRHKPQPVVVRAWLNRYRVWARNEAPLTFARYGAVALAWEAVRLARLARCDRQLAHAVCRGAAAATMEGLRWRRAG